MGLQFFKNASFFISYWNACYKPRCTLFTYKNEVHQGEMVNSTAVVLMGDAWAAVVDDGRGDGGVLSLGGW